MVLPCLSVDYFLVGAIHESPLRCCLCQYAEKMIGHHAPFFQFDVIAFVGDFHPFIGDDFPRSQSVTV